MNERRRIRLSPFKNSKLALKRRKSIDKIGRMARLLPPLSSGSTPSLVSDHYDLSIFIDDRRYYDDGSATEMTYEDAVYRLKIRAGPVFLNETGERVWFDDVSWDIQCGMINSLIRPIKDKDRYCRSMPKGKWSDYESSSNVGCAGDEEDDDCDSTRAEVADDGDYMSSGSKSPSCWGDPVLSTAATGPTPDTSAAPSPTHDYRKDSAFIPDKPPRYLLMRPSETTTIVPSIAPSTRPTMPLTAPPTPIQEPRTPTTQPNLHEKLTFDDSLEYGCIARRTMPWIEKARHRSKYSSVPTIRELKARASEVVLSGPGLRRIGNVHETLAKEHPMSWHRLAESSSPSAKGQERRCDRMLMEWHEK